MRAATEGNLPPVMPKGNLLEVLGRGVKQGSPGELIVERTPSRQRHAQKQLAEHMRNPDEPPLHDPMQAQLQHLPPILDPGDPPAWVPDDVIYNDNGLAYHYPQPLRTMAHIRGSHANKNLMNSLQDELQTVLYFSAPDPSLLLVHLQKRGA